MFGDLAIHYYSHYRTAVHPLFVILFQPIICILDLIFNDPIFSILLLQSIFSSLSLTIMYSIMNKLKVSKRILWFLLYMFAISFGQVTFTIFVETYIFAQFFLLLLWWYVLIRLDKKLESYDYFFLIILGILSLAVTVTNFIQYIIAMFILIITNKNVKKRYFVYLSLIGLSFIFTVFLAVVQNIIWQSAPNFFTKIATDFLYGKSEEELYITTNIGINNFKNVINANFANNFNISSLTLKLNSEVIFAESLVSNVISLITYIIFIVLNIIYIFKKKFDVKNNKYYFGLLIVYFLNLIFHLFYGNATAFLYVCHSNFLLILIIAEISKTIKINFKYSKYLYFSAYLIFGTLLVKNLCILFSIFFNIYYNSSSNRIMSYIVVFTCLAFIVFMNIKKRMMLKITLLVLSALILYFSWNKMVSLGCISNFEKQHWGSYNNYIIFK